MKIPKLHISKSNRNLWMFKSLKIDYVDKIICYFAIHLWFKHGLFIELKSYKTDGNAPKYLGNDNYTQEYQIWFKKQIVKENEI